MALGDYDNIVPRAVPGGLPPINAMDPATVAALESTFAPAISPVAPAPAPVNPLVHTPASQAAKEDALRAAAKPAAPTVAAPGVAPPSPDHASPPSNEFSIPYSPAMVPAGGGTKTDMLNTGHTTTERGELSEEQRANLQKQNDLAEEQKKLQAEQAEIKRKDLETQEAFARAEEMRVKQREEDLASVDAEATKAVVTAQDNWKQEVQAKRTAREGLKEYWSAQPKGKQIIAAIAVLANAIIRGSQGQASDALQIYQNISRQDREDKLQDIAAMDENIAMAATGIADAEGAREKLRTSTLARYAALDERAALQLKETLLRNGMPAVDVEKNANILAIESGKLEKEQAALAPTLKKIQDQRNKFRAIVTQTGSGSGDQSQLAAAAEAVNKAYEKDPERKAHDESVGMAIEQRELLAGLDNAIKAGPAAVGLYMTRMASAAQKGVLSDKDMARAMGNEYKSFFTRNKEGVLQFLGGEPPRATIDSMRNMLKNNVVETNGRIRKLQESLIEKAPQVGLPPAVVAGVLGNSEVRMTPMAPQAQAPQLTPEKIAQFKAMIAADPKNPKAQELAKRLAAMGVK